MQSVVHRVDAERAELELVLSSKSFGRNNYVGRFLSFVCERYFDGSTSEIKEYSIAVHGRRGLQLRASRRTFAVLDENRQIARPPPSQ